MQSVLSGKKILLGITAGIAAYKSAFLVRLLVQSGATVKIVMTPEAKAFVTPLTLSTLSNNEVFSSFTNEEGEAWNNHVELGLWADLMLFAPVTANTLSKMANGHADNLLLATYLSAKCPVFVAPAMDLDMYAHPSTEKNIKKLRNFKVEVIPAESGELASGLEGQGRMAEPEHIIDFLEKKLKASLPLYQKKVLITAGPTYEPIDPVRFIGNHSSGKMGFALADAAAEAGAQVTLISGPSALTTNSSAIRLIRVTTTEEMYQAVHRYYAQTDIAIAAAAVSDYKPVQVAKQKVKKSNENWSISLEKTKDILLSMGEQKKQQLLIGFALETEHEIEHAQAKRARKNLDFIVLNSLKDKGAGFGKSTNKVRIIYPGTIKEFELKPKEEVARDIVNELIQLGK